jgi:hypothetical protein
MKGTPVLLVGPLTSKPTWWDTSGYSTTSAFFIDESATSGDLKPDASVQRNTQMPIGILFWVIMVVWLLFGLYWNRGDLRGGRYGVIGGNLMLFILLFLLGWKTFGFILQ